MRIENVAFMSSRIIPLLAASWLAIAAPAVAQMHAAPIPAPNPLHIAIDASALAGLPRATLTATDEGGHTDTYAGVRLADLLARAGAPSGKAVRGKAMTAVVVVGASDGYHVLFTLPELDASFTDRVVLLADEKDGVPIAGDAGPYRLIVPFDKREARWVRGVTSVDLTVVPIP